MNNSLSNDIVQDVLADDNINERVSHILILSYKRCYPTHYFCSMKYMHVHPKY